MKRISDYNNKKDCKTISSQFFEFLKLSERSYYLNLSKRKMSIFNLYNDVPHDGRSIIQKENNIFYKYHKMTDARFNVYSTMSSMRPIDNSFKQVAEACDYRNDMEVTL